jgi:subtilase family serine protease
VAIRNDGTAAAGPFDVGLTVGATALADQTVPGLAAGGRTVVEFTGAACAPGATVSVVVDPEDVVAEATDADDSRTITCR